MSNSGGHDYGLISVEVDGAPIYDEISGSDATAEDLGFSSVRVTRPRLYTVLENLKKEGVEITLRFPLADQIPVSLYGLRFGA